MHVPDHASVLPDPIDPFPMPDTRREAEMLTLLVDAGVYPHLRPHSDRRDFFRRGMGRKDDMSGVSKKGYFIDPSQAALHGTFRGR